MILVAYWILFVSLVILAVVTLVAISRGALTLVSVCEFLVYLTGSIIIGSGLIGR